MKYVKTIFVIILLLNCYIVEAQVVRKNTKFRVSFGLSVFAGEQINDVIRGLESATRQINQPLDLTHFKSYFQFGLEYEKDIIENFTAAISVDYYSDNTSGSSYDFRLDIEQAANYKFKYSVIGISLIYYYPVVEMNIGHARIFAGGGFEYVYSDIDLYYGYREWAVEKYYDINIKKNGFDEGGKIFTGFEIPVMESSFLQLRSGYAFREIKDLSKQNDITEQTPFDPRVLDKNKFDFSSFFLTFGFAYYF